MRIKPIAFGLLIGCLVTPVAVILAIAASTAGQRDYAVATLLFPMAALIGTISGPLIFLAVAQYPIYGWLIGAGWKHGRSVLGLLIVLTIHLGALGFVVFVPINSFGDALAYQPARSYLCETSERFAWGGQRGSYALQLNSVHYHFTVKDSGSPSRTTGAIEKVHWIWIEGFTAGRAVGWYAPPMLYDPGTAVLTINGRSVSALPKIWKGEFVDAGLQRPGDLRTPTGVRPSSVEVPTPTNLNASSAAASDGFFIAFPIEKLEAADEYEFAPGSVLLDGERVQLPVQRSCHCPWSVWRIRRDPEARGERLC